MEKYTMAAGEPDLRLIRALTLLRNGRELFIWYVSFWVQASGFISL